MNWLRRGTTKGSTTASPGVRAMAPQTPSGES